MGQDDGKMIGGGKPEHREGMKLEDIYAGISNCRTCHSKGKPIIDAENQMYFFGCDKCKIQWEMPQSIVHLVFQTEMAKLRLDLETLSLQFERLREKVDDHLLIREYCPHKVFSSESKYTNGELDFE